MRLLFACLIASLSSLPSFAAPKLGTQICDALIQRYQPTIDAMTGKGWDHSNSAILHGMEKIYAHTGEQRYHDYIRTYVDHYVAADGSVTGLRPELDGIQPGILCLFLYQTTQEEKYRIAAQTMRDHILGGADHPPFPKTPEGGFWHKSTEKYRNVMTVDGTYMAYPFLLRYGLLFDDREATNTAIDQTLLAAERSFNIKTKLPFHAWSYDKNAPWAHPVTGTSTQHWSRCSGWFSMALADLLEHLPADHPKHPQVLRLYRDLAEGLAQSQDPATGMWYHVPDQIDAPGNYPESSGTGMAIYSLQKGIRAGWLDATTYQPTVDQAWDGLLQRVSPHPDGGPRLNSATPAMGCQISLEDYLAIRPVSVPSDSGRQHPHNYIAFLMAASVMEN